MSTYPWTQADQTPEIDALANDAGIAAEEAKAEQAAEPFETCLWTEDNDIKWDTACGESFVFDDGGPYENGFIFCCYCGKRLAFEYYDCEMEDDDL